MRKKRGGYAGSASFEFEVERYLNVKTGELIFEDSLPEDAEESDFEYQCIELSVEGHSYFTSGRTQGDPDDAFPDEGDTEITSIQGPGGEDWSNKISDSERDKILDQLAELSKDSCCDYNEDRDYDRDDYFDDRCDNYDGVF
jgi:hypothetical protein